MFKVGGKGISYVYIVPNIAGIDRNYEICISEDGDDREYRASTIKEANKMRGEVIEGYPDVRIFLLKEESTIVKRIQ